MRDEQVIFGEVLFDVFEDGLSVLGGAPFNVAWHLTGFGEAPLFVSRVGDDELGQEVRDRMRGWGMRLEGLQTDPTHPTGQVTVSTRGGEPHYTIEPEQAYDHIDPAGIDVAGGALLYHGTLAARGRSREALEALRTRPFDAIVVDVNLREPWWDRDDVLHWLEGVTTVKLSDGELPVLDAQARTTGGDLFARVRSFREQTGVDRVVLTRGEEGALCVDARDEVRVAPEPSGEVVDTVGAGDAFTAVLLLGRLRRWSIGITLERAQQFASRIVAQRGATNPDREMYDDFATRWRGTR